MTRIQLADAVLFYTRRTQRGQCVFGTQVSRAKAAKPIEMLFGGRLVV